MHAILKQVIAGGAIASIAVGASAQVDHLLISEVAPGGPGGAEFTEIFNPTASAVDLTNYYLADNNNYLKLPTDEDGLFDMGTSDNILRFPAGTSLNSGQVAVIVQNKETFINSFFSGNASAYAALPGSPLLFEVTDSDFDTSTDMLHLNNDGPGDFNWGMTNSNTDNGEFNVLFRWDGVEDLVKDADIVGWGNPTGTPSNMFDPQTTAGKNNTPYLPYTGTHAGNISVLNNTGVVIATRTSIEEASEVATGGNGITGHDESTEMNTVSWSWGAISAATPGATNLTVVGVSPPPVVNSVERDIQYPTSSQTINIVANVTDPDNTVQTVNIYVNTGSGFVATPAASTGADNFSAAIGPFADDSIVKYYVEAIDNTGSSALFPASAPADFKVFVVDNTPVSEGDVVFNEILYDVSGSEGGDREEFVELHNTRNTPINLAYFRFAENNFAWFTLPEDAIIPANGFMVLTLDPTNLPIQWSIPGDVKVYDWGTNQLNNGGDDIRLAHPNSFEYNDATTLVDNVVFTNASPWPPVVPGTTIELKNPILDNSMGANWELSTALELGTPGNPNSVLSSAPAISGVTRSLEFPAPTDPITISTTVTAVSGTTIQAVRLYVDTGSGFAATNMTANGNIYSATIPAQADGTLVKYYIEAVSSAGTDNTSVDPIDAPTGYRQFVIDDNPVGADDIVINEILYKNIGAEEYEYVELYNRRGTPVSLDHFLFGDATANNFTFPEGSVIMGNSYMVLSLDPILMGMHYTIPDGIPVLDWGTFQLNAAGDRVFIAHVNSVNFNGTTTAFDEVNYTDETPWPTANGDTTGQSIELLSPELDNSIGSNWVNSVPLLPEGTPGSGTPGAENTGEPSNVANWTLY